MVQIDEALLKGFDKPVILWLLSHKPRYGYGIIMELKRLTGRSLKPSMVYPFLHRLEEKGFAVGEWVVEGKRRVKYYSLTKKGEMLLHKLRGLFQRPIREILTSLLFK